MPKPKRPKAPKVNLKFFRYVGQIAHDWATLEYLVAHCIWKAANLDDTLGACVTAQIFSLPPRLGALVLLLRARGASSKLIADLNKFIERSRMHSETRNRAVHDPLGAHATDGTVRQIQITAQGKLVFEMRRVKLKDFETDSEKIADFLGEFLSLKDRIEVELDTLPYTPQLRFPVITRGTQ